MNKILSVSFLFFVAVGFMATAQAEDYVIDTKGMHAAIEFRIKHLGFSFLVVRFNKFKGNFSFDEKNSEKNSAQVEIDVASLDSNHAERDKHLRSAKFFDVSKYPLANFVSTGYTSKNVDTGVLTGKLTLRGVTKEIRIDVRHIGNGPDPWGGYRRGFEGRATLHLSDYKMSGADMLGSAAENVELFLYVEGVRSSK